jgi:glycosyltransferase-like protein
MKPLRIAMLTYSLRPRGGVVHALEVSAALARRGHEVEVMALGRPAERFFREPAVPSRIVRFQPPDVPFDQRIQAMLEAYADGLAEPLREGGFDLVHSQDCLSANAALTLREHGLIDHVIRTVHHIDDFSSPSLIECQDRSIVGPDALLCVSAPWVRRLADEYGVQARLVRNGVDARRHRPARSAAERDRDRAVAGLNGQLTILTVGGIEPRKGSMTLLEAFARLRELAPELDPLLLVAGGATLFDYRHEIDRFQAAVSRLGLDDRVRVLGSLSDGELSRLYRAADLFAFPSTKEGFGLAALEALASGLPVVASDLDALRSFLEHGRSALLVPADDRDELASAFAALAHDRDARDRLRAGGRAVAAAFSWDAAAAAHERAYAELLVTLGRGRGRGPGRGRAAALPATAWPASIPRPAAGGR